MPTYLLVCMTQVSFPLVLTTCMSIAPSKLHLLANASWSLSTVARYSDDTRRK